MAAYTESEINAKFKHIMLMNGAEIIKELAALERMSIKLKPLLHPTNSDIGDLESKIDEIIKIYVSFKYGSIDEDAMNSILEHRLGIISVLTANAAIGGAMIGYLNADKQIIQDKSDKSIETVAVMYGNKNVTETEDTKSINVNTSAKSSIKDNTKKFLDIIANGVK